MDTSTTESNSTRRPETGSARNEGTIRTRRGWLKEAEYYYGVTQCGKFSSW